MYDNVTCTNKEMKYEMISNFEHLFGSRNNPPVLFDKAPILKAVY